MQELAPSPLSELEAEALYLDALSTVEPERFDPEQDRIEELIYTESLVKHYADALERGKLAVEFAQLGEESNLQEEGSGEHLLEASERYFGHESDSLDKVDEVSYEIETVLGVEDAEIGQVLVAEAEANENKRELDLLLQEMMPAALQLFERGIDNGTLPEIVRGRLPTIADLDIRTIINNEADRFRNTTGMYSHDSKIVRLLYEHKVVKNTEQYQEYIDEVFHDLVHELLHHLAGRQVTFNDGIPSEVRDYGLDFSYTEGAIGEKEAVSTTYWWLDEAVTDHLALVLTKGLDGKSVVFSEGTYRVERTALDELVAGSGIPIERFVDAYFEAKLVGISTKKYDDLFENIEYELGQTILVDINSLINEVEDYLKFSDAVAELMYKSRKEQSR